MDKKIKNDKQLGFTKWMQPLDNADCTLPEAQVREQRQTKREELLSEYAAASPEHAWKDLDGEDFA